MLNKLDAFHNSKPGYSVFTLFGLVMAYVFISLAINSGSWYDYLITLLALVVFLQNFIKLIALFLKKPQGVRK